MPVERRGQVTGVGIDRSTGNGRNRLVLAEGGSCRAALKSVLPHFRCSSRRVCGCNQQITNKFSRVWVTSRTVRPLASVKGVATSLHPLVYGP